MKTQCDLERERLGRTLYPVVALAEEVGPRPRIGQYHLGLAGLRRRTGHRDAAQHLAAATATFRELGMSFWEERAVAETNAG